MRYLRDEQNSTLNNEEKKMLEQLERFLSINCQKYLTPHILAELSNLINKETSSPEGFSRFMDLIKSELVNYEEIHIKKEAILREKSVNQFGIADTAINILSKENNKIILTKDGDFCKHCKYVERLPVLHLEDLDSLFLTFGCFSK